MQKSFQAWLQPGYGAFRLDYNADRLEALATERASEWDRIGKASFLTLDEQREAVGYGRAPKDAIFGKLGGGFERRYSPGQPRVPAGSAEGGQWTSGGGGGGGVTGSVSLLGDGEQVALNIDPNVAADTGLGDLLHSVADFLVNLADEEGGAHGGHAIQEHVGKDQNYLINRIRASIWGNRFAGSGYSRAGTFPSLMAANKLINSVLAENRALLEQVINGSSRSQIRLNKWFSSRTGIEAFTDRPWDRGASIGIRDTFGAAVVIVKNPKVEKGFSVITAFPFFDLKE